MIVKLEHRNEKISQHIFTLFQSAYKVEADLIGVKNFPPLLRDSTNIQQSKTVFYGFYDKESLAAVIEIEILDKQLSIDSLTVGPQYFRKGIASKLINYVVQLKNFINVTVETAVANAPAIKLYQQHGFVEFKKWTPDHGIPKVAMSTMPTIAR